jgi:hypothetical protein
MLRVIPEEEETDHFFAIDVNIDGAFLQMAPLLQKIDMAIQNHTSYSNPHTWSPMVARLSAQQARTESRPATQYRVA